MMKTLSDAERKEIAEKFLETAVEDVKKAHSRIETFIHRTSLYRSLWLSDDKTNVYFKMESEQITGSFKARGAFNKMCLLKESNDWLAKENHYSVTIASSGNHGLACAVAMKTFGIAGKIFVPEYASEAKCEAIRKSGGNLEKFGDDCVKAEMRAKVVANETENTLYISPYNDTEVVHGQATIGLEILEDLPNVDAVFACNGGGGLVSGIAAYMKSIKPSVKIVSCQPVNSCVMSESYKAGKILDLSSLPTLSDGSSGGVDPDAFTFDLCCQLVDEWVVVSEDEIENALMFMLEKEHKLVEGAAAVCIAAYEKVKINHRGENVVLLMCGRNIGLETLYPVIDRVRLKNHTISE